MQNIDYARRLNKITPGKSYTALEENGFGEKEEIFGEKINILGKQTGKPYLMFFIAFILTFTAGLLTGLKISQKESSFSEKNSGIFKNKGKGQNQLTDSKSESSERLKPGPALKKTESIPPQGNMVLLFHSITEENMPVAIKTVTENFPEYRDMLLKTSSGKLYLGYFTSREDAIQAQKELLDHRKVLGGTEIKQIQP